MTEIATPPIPLAVHGADPLTGRFAAPGDRAISQRALILGALAVGRTTIEGLPEAKDVLATAEALRHLGVVVESREGAWLVSGLGVGGLLESRAPLQLGNSVASAALLLGLLAPYDFTTQLIAGSSLTQAQLQPVLDALAPTGVQVVVTDHAPLAFSLRGAATPLPASQRLATLSEGVKSALLLAGLHIPGTTTIVEPVATGDHTEKLLAAFGATITTTFDPAGMASIALTGLPELRPRRVIVPGDPSAAGYAIVAALIVPGSDLLVDNVLINPTRTGLIDTLLEMGGDIQFLNQRETGGEHVADLRVRSSRMKGIRVDAAHAAAMLDDIPLLAVAAAFAKGETVIEGLFELRGPQTDRLAATAAGLAANKVSVVEGEASLTIGGSGRVDGGGMVTSRGDPAIAMSFLVLGFASRYRVTIDDTAAIAASFPGFVAAMTEMGARFEPVGGR